MFTSAAPDTAPPLSDSPSSCFVCAPTHPSGMRIRYDLAADGSVEARWTPDRSWEGFPGIVHGGIVCTILDEAMSKAVSALGCKALTAELKVRFRRPVPPGQELAIRGWIIDRCKRRLRTEAIVTSVDGSELAHAWGSFLSSSGPHTDTEAGLR